MIPFVPSGLDPNLEQQLLLLQRQLSKVIAGAAGGAVVYRPGAPSEGNCLGTWAEVMAVVAQSERAAIYVDTSKQTPIGAPAVVPPGVYDMRFSFVGSVALPSGLVVLELADGAVLDNLGAVADSLELRCSPTTGPCLTFSAFPGGVPWVLATYRGSVIDNLGTVPAVEVPTGQLLVVAAVLDGFIGPQAAPCGTPIVNAQAGAFVAVVSTFGNWADNWLSGQGASFLSYVGVTSDYRAPVIPLFAGVAGPLVLREKAAMTEYQAAVAADWNNNPPATVADALDRIAAQIGPIT